MGRFVKGDVVVLPFPFSDLSSSKRRPALVIANASGNEVILAQITSQSFQDRHAIEIAQEDFSSGGLNLISNVRPNKLFTADENIIAYSAGNLNDHAIRTVVDKIVSIISENG